jgi:hypothetical protein
MTFLTQIPKEPSVLRWQCRDFFGEQQSKGIQA